VSDVSIGPMMQGRAKKDNLMNGKIETYTNNAKLTKNTRGIRYIVFTFINIHIKD